MNREGIHKKGGLQPFGQLETFSSKVMLFTSEPQFKQLQKRNLKKIAMLSTGLEPLTPRHYM